MPENTHLKWSRRIQLMASPCVRCRSLSTKVTYPRTNEGERSRVQSYPTHNVAFRCVRVSRLSTTTRQPLAMQPPMYSPRLKSTCSFVEPLTRYGGVSQSDRALHVNPLYILVSFSYRFRHGTMHGERNQGRSRPV